MNSSREAVVAVDVGGTFTDAVLIDADGAVHTAKALTTPEDQSTGVLTAIEKVLGTAGRTKEELGRFVHGTTAATNALLERKGSRVAFLTTKGFGDLLVMRRQDRPDLYDLSTAHPDPLARSEDVIEVEERHGPTGLLTPLSSGEIERVVGEVRRLEPDAVAICLLFSFAFPDHEQALAAALRSACPELDVVASSELVPEFREYERATTTVVDAYLAARVNSYLERLVERCREEGVPAPLIMQSSGGVAPIEDRVHPVHLVLSGPAGGLNGAQRVARALAIENAVTLDMGGTSTDVGVIERAGVRRASGLTMASLPLLVASFDLTTVGAGGGSIAWTDAGGALQVGPRSAGAAPGPACYGQGGTEPTVTDAHVVLGHIDPAEGVGGIELDREGARRAIGTVAADFDSIEAAAAGVIAVADVEMAQAVRTMTVDRGLDPREFHVIAFGGAGPLHAVAVAEELGMPGVVVPFASGVLSALGMASSELRFDFSQTLLSPLSDLDPDRLDGIAAAMLAKSPYQADQIDCVCDLRYAGQSFELPVRYQPGAAVTELRSDFEDLHERTYGFSYREGEVELVTVRVGAIRTSTQPLRASLPAAPAAEPPAVEDTMISGAEGPIPARLLRLPDAGATLPEPLAGPAMIQLPTATCAVPRGWSARMTDSTALLVEREAR